MMPTDVKALLTRKVGPLPVWAWGGAAAGGILVTRWIQGRSDGTASAAGGTLADSLIPADSGNYYTPPLPDPIPITDPVPLPEPPIPCPPGFASDGAGGCVELPPLAIPCPPGFASDGAGGCVELPPVAVPCPPGFASDGAGGCIELPGGGGGGGGGGCTGGRKPNKTGRACDRGWHLAKTGKCKGKCVKNTGTQAAASAVVSTVARVFLGPPEPEYRAAASVPISGAGTARETFPAGLGASVLPEAPARITALLAPLTPEAPASAAVPEAPYLPTERLTILTPVPKGPPLRELAGPGAESTAPTSVPVVYPTSLRTDKG